MAELAVSPEPASPPPVDAVVPIPPRYWWLKRCAVAGLILLAAIAISRWWWGVYASRALQAEIDRLRAAGEPLDPQDFDLPPVPDELNAALPLKAALAVQAQIEAAERRISAAIEADIRERSREGEVDFATLRELRRQRNTLATQPDDATEAATRAEYLARIRELAHEARLRPSVDWGLGNISLAAPSPPRILPYDRIVDYLKDAALAAHRQGDDAAAFDILEDMLAVADHVGAYRTLLAGLVVQATSGRVWEVLQTILLDAGATTGSLPVMRPARREQIVALMDRLLDEGSLKEAFVWGMQAERSFQYQMIQLVVSGQEPVPFARGDLSSGVLLWPFLVRPVYQLDGARVLRHASALVEMAKAENAPEATRREPHFRPLGGSLDLQARFLSALLSPNLGKTAEASFARVAKRRMTVVALAIHLYECDHGHLPATLDELVPEYLPSIPENPLLDDHSPIQYRLEAGNACLYAPSRTGPPPAGKHMADISWRFKLRVQPTTAPATRPVPKHVSRAN